MTPLGRTLFLTSWHFDWLVYLLIVGMMYHFLTGHVAKKYHLQKEPLTFWRKFSFYSGLFVIFLCNGTPILDLGMDYLFSAHMLSMALMYLILPPAIILGLPDWMYRKLFQFRLLKTVFSWFTHPIITILLFNLFFSIYHVPFIFNALSVNLPFHLAYHYFLVVLAFMMWWPIVCPIQEMDKMSELQKMAYIYANGVLLTPACALIIFGGTPIYTHFMDAPRVFHVFTVIYDQQFGGVIMKLIQEIIYGFALGYVFRNWVKKQRMQDEEEKNQEIKGYGYLEVSKKTRTI